MNPPRNPFRASLGSTPPYIAGRAGELRDFTDALLDGPGTHERIALVTGLRGVGKTVLLNAFEEEAQKQSWWVISETATKGFTDRIRDSLFRLAEDALRTHKKRITGLTLPSLGGLQFSESEEHKPDVTLRFALTKFLDWQEELSRRLGQEPVGLLITVDELHYYRQDEVIEFGSTIQHLVREDREIAVAMAGIPQAIRPLLANQEGRNPVTFLRRANRIDLGLIPDDEVRRALEEPVLNAGCAWEPEALEIAVRECGGYPFMIQLLGQQCFRNKDAQTITVESTEQAAPAARRKLGQLVHEPSFSDLSQVDRTFLLAMAVDDGPSKMSAISERLNVNSQYAGTYRRRLIEAEIIESAGYGKVDFELPYMRDFLRTQAPYQVFRDNAEK